MRVAIAALTALLWQTSGVGGTPSEHLRWQRGIDVPVAGGPVCVVLDAQTLGHAESRSSDDLRVFRQSDGSEVEVPFSLMESEAEPEDIAEATVRDVTVRGSEVAFDLVMPRRVYSSVVLKLAARDFTGRALVTAKDSGKVLGSFAVFDLSGEGLARSTTLALAETTLPELHVVLKMAGVGGRAFSVSPSMVEGAEVPTSREAQTLYTVVASTPAVQRSRYGTEEMQMDVPAHVPVERVSFVLDPEFRGEFSRGVTVGGVLPVSGEPAASEETVTGIIWHVQRPGMAGSPPIEAGSLQVDAVLGLTLRAPARVLVAVNDVVQGRALPPLPIREVRLEMRQRSVCFGSEAGAQYVLRYGDGELGAPVYKQMAMLQGAAMAMAGPESENPRFQRGAARRGVQQRAGLVWVLGMAGLVLLWAGVGSLIRRRGGHA